jgi:YidC/Oxa1 family membrane protein insertase
MKLRLSFLSLALSCLLLAAGGAQAQGIAAPPAYNVAQRLKAEMQAAAAAHNPQIEHNRAVQAIAKYNQVVASRTFGSTPWGADSLYQVAVLQNTVLKDPNAAIQSLQKLQNNDRSVQFPQSQAAAQLQTTLEDQVDQQNSHKILYKIMGFFVGMFGGRHFSYSYALAILFISVIIRLALAPLSNKQFASMREMQKLQPKIKEMQTRYKNDKELQGRKTMELYKENGVNPAAGCLPMLVQLPILYLLYYMIRLYQYQFVHGKFLWIGSPLAHLVPGGIVASSLEQQDIPLLLLYALSMYVTQKLTVTPSLDPQQAEQQRMMQIMTPFLSTYFFLQWHLPSAFVLYYLVFNILSTAQQKYYMKKRHAGILGETEPDGSSDGGLVKALLATDSSSGGGAKALPAPKNGSDNGSRRGLPNRARPTTPVSENSSNGSVPSAKGVIAPAKVHPKKKRR